ncbi:hypothetical protein TURU_001204 [Turdus rufiventris]|nr:hypothetical protein TURU_001204 [Turdus rufiventris]
MDKDRQSKVHPDWEKTNVHFAKKLDTGKTSAQNEEKVMARGDRKGDGVVAHVKEDRREPESLSLMDPLVIIKLGDKEEKMEFLVDTGATYLVLNKTLMPITDNYIMLRGQLANLKEHIFVNH